MTDAVRSTIAVDHPSDIHKVVATLKEHGLAPVRATNRVDKPKNGYRDLLFNVRYPNGHIGELQVHVKDVLHAKEVGEGHHVYEHQRAIERAVKHRTGKDEVEDADLHPHERAALKNLAVRSKAIYDQAWAKAQSRPRSL